MSLKELRRMMDRVDEKLVEAIAERIRVARMIGGEKKRLGLPVVDENREREVYKHALEKASARGLDPVLVEKVFSIIIDHSRRVQGCFKVAYLGPRGSFTMEAAEKYFSGKPYALQPYPTIRSVFKSVEEAEADYGVTPVENSLEGPVSETLDCLASSGLSIVGEEVLKIAFHLSSRERRLEDVRIVFSNPHALAQVRMFLDRVMPEARIREVSSTSKAALMAAKTRGGAAVCSEAAAREYGLRILARNIQDERENYTRFLVLSREASKRFKGAARTMLIMILEHKPGSLYRALGVFAKHGLNLTRIESRPVRGKPWEYMFLVEFEGASWDHGVHRALENLKRRAVEIRLLGSYRPAEH
ncbi:MAG: prephenate dehydratase [Candidatus Brockarchaeota archaeon]|nr:prephenate dehydratase [Candidatus Brockarchaeota archaeon]